MKTHIPQKGDFIMVSFNMRAGDEQKSRRPVLVVSNTLFNEETGLVLVCPITTTDSGYPFHVAITGAQDVKGFVMAEQVRTIDYRARQAKVIRKAPHELLDEVLAILDTCIY